jgi:hypothetical protein
LLEPVDEVLCTVVFASIMGPSVLVPQCPVLCKIRLQLNVIPQVCMYMSLQFCGLRTSVNVCWPEDGPYRPKHVHVAIEIKTRYTLMTGTESRSVVF